MEKMVGKDSWVVAVASSLMGEIRADADKYNENLIHKVPKSFLSKQTTVFYQPRVISFGPYHFQKNDEMDDDMELLKSDVARKMNLKIKSNDGLISVVGKFERENQQRLQESYATDFKLSSEVCAWMIVRDACLILEVLERFREDEDPEKSVSVSIDSILSRKRHHPLLPEIVKDMLMMENQLPFWALEEIRLHIEGSNDDIWFESALKNLSPIKAPYVGNREYNRGSHILQLLHDYIVDSPVTDDSNNQLIKTDILFGIFSCLFFCFVENDSDVSDKAATKNLTSRRCMKLLFKILGCVIILLVLSPVLAILFLWGIIFAIWYSIKNFISPKVEEIGDHVPTVEELKRVGVKFKSLEDRKPIRVSDIKFKEKNSTLYLPKINIDNRSEVILRNLIALEIFSRKKEKPITRYALLMNDLVNTNEDVGILRREGIITSKLGSDDEIAQLWNSMVTATEMPRYDSIDKASQSINHYRKMWWKVLWAQFIMVHCSKPWLFLSLLAGVTLLLLTFVQVICLFESCQLK